MAKKKTCNHLWLALEPVYGDGWGAGWVYCAKCLFKRKLDK